MKWYIWIIGLAAMLVIYAVYVAKPPEQEVPTTSQTVITTKTEPRTIKWGAYAGSNLSDKLEFENRIGIKPDIVAVFVHWGNESEYPTIIANDVKSNKQTLLIFWESKNYNYKNLNERQYSYDAIIKGEWDAYINSFGQAIKDSGQPVVLIPFEEVNGNWNPWSITVNNNSAIKHILAYRKIHDMLGDIPNLKFGWAVNNGSAPDTDENSIANLYPGSDYVDYVGVDGFNFDDPWQTFSEVFDEPLSILKGFNKPIMLFSMASAEGKKKPAWIDDMGVQILARPEIDGFVWFNENKEKDWRIWSDPQSLKAFQNMLHLMVPSEPIPDSQ